MVSRRKILSRSRDDLSYDPTYFQREEDDVWYQREKLFKVTKIVINLIMKVRHRRLSQI